MDLGFGTRAPNQASPRRLLKSQPLAKEWCHGSKWRHGYEGRTGPLSSSISTEGRIPTSHLLRRLRCLADQALDRLTPHICRRYPEGGRPSFPPEQLLLALLLQAIYGIRLERLLIEQLEYILLFR